MSRMAGEACTKAQRSSEPCDLFEKKNNTTHRLSQIVMMSWKKKRKEKVSYRRVMNQVFELVSFVDLIWYVHTGRLCGLCYGFLCWYTFVYGWR